MIDRNWLARIGLALFAVATFGCAMPYRYCEDGCGPAGISGRYGGAEASCNSCESGCASCDGAVAAGACAAGDACGAGGCGPAACGPRGLLDMLHRGLGCNSGCGGFYWSEWTYDPPDNCDPCDDCGNWVGPRCCWPRGWLALWQGLHGRRFAGGCGGDCCGGCSSGCEGSLGTEGTLLEGDIPEGAILEGESLQPGLMEFEESPISYPGPANMSRTMGRTGSPSHSGTTRSCLKRR